MSSSKSRDGDRRTGGRALVNFAILSSAKKPPQAGQLLRRGQHPPDFLRHFEELGAVGIIEKNDQFLMIRDSLNQRLKSEDRTAMHGDRLACVWRIGCRNEDGPP